MNLPGVTSEQGHIFDLQIAQHALEEVGPPIVIELGHDIRTITILAARL